MTATNLIAINCRESEVRVALVEGSVLAELLVERKTAQEMVGNIYKGTVTRVLPGMNAAFINIGETKSGFLYGGDIIDQKTNTGKRVHATDASQEDNPKPAAPSKPIQSLIKEGQQISVQIAKKPIGTKGPRVTLNLTVPGRYLVLMPYHNRLAISRRIVDEATRDRLRTVVDEVVPDGYGVVIRTAATEASREELQNDAQTIVAKWEGIRKTITTAKPPSLLYRDLDPVLRTVRDVYNSSVDTIIVDDPDVLENLRAFLRDSIPGAEAKLTLYQESKPIFDEVDVEFDIARALAKRVDLPSGGYLVIDQTEALTSFDVNTGKYVGKADVQDTILATNLEAIDGVCEQLRVRNIGGIIVLDFIDMESQIDRDRVYQTLVDKLKEDRARTNVLKISELGLIQMTRKRTRESLEKQLLTPCPYCQGTGHVRSTATEAYDLLREILRISVQTGQTEFRVRARPDLLQWINESELELFEDLFAKNGLQVEFEKANLSLDLFREPAYEVVAANR